MKCYLCLTRFLVAVCGAWAYSESPPQTHCDHNWTKRILIFKLRRFQTADTSPVLLLFWSSLFFTLHLYLNVPRSGERVLPSSETVFIPGLIALWSSVILCVQLLELEIGYVSQMMVFTLLRRVSSGILMVVSYYYIWSGSWVEMVNGQCRPSPNAHFYLVYASNIIHHT